MQETEFDIGMPLKTLTYLVARQGHTTELVVWHCLKTNNRWFMFLIILIFIICLLLKLPNVILVFRMVRLILYLFIRSFVFGKPGQVQLKPVSVTVFSETSEHFESSLYTSNIVSYFRITKVSRLSS